MNDSNGPLRDYKRSLHEGGIRVPLIANWPGQIAAGSTSDFIGANWDFLPTMVELTGEFGVFPKDVDGISFYNELIGKPHLQPRHDYLYWAFYEKGGGQAIRKGKWKLIQQPYHTPPRLYNLERDLGEIRDVAEDHPNVVDELVNAMEEEYMPSGMWRFPSLQEWKLGQERRKNRNQRRIK